MPWLIRALLWTSIALYFSSPHISSQPARPPLQLWYWHGISLVTDDGVARSKELIDRAAKTGYTGVAFWENGFARMSSPSWPPENTRRIHEVLQYAASKGLHVMALAAPYGWSNAGLQDNGSYAETQRVIGAKFRVDSSRKSLDFVGGPQVVENGGFEGGKTNWFDTDDSGIGLTEAAHRGKHAGVIVDAPGNARLRQKLILTPWRQYHLSLWFRSTEFTGSASVEVQNWWHRSSLPFRAEIPAAGRHDWTRLDFAFDSGSTTAAYLYLGVWGGNRGLLAFDDIRLEETALVYVARRCGSPLRVYDPYDPSLAYEEGSDFEYIHDERLGPPRAVFKDSYHEPPTVSLPPTTRLRAGQIVSVDFYAVFPIGFDNQAGFCLTEPAVFTWVKRNAEAVASVLPQRSALLLSYDEMRQMNTCGSCRQKGWSAGQLLAWNFQRTASTLRAMLPSVDLYTWSDMFDPLHNAHDRFYLVEGDLEGSWKGMGSYLGILNWNHAHLHASLRWFSGLEADQPVRHRQIIAGYYDGGNGNEPETDFREAADIPGIEGIMYVTWQNDYSKLEQFAESARRGWSRYPKLGLQGEGQR